jgi:hypothetical protein
VDDKVRRNGPSRIEIYPTDGRGGRETLLEEPVDWLTVTDWR